MGNGKYLCDVTYCVEEHLEQSEPMRIKLICMLAKGDDDFHNREIEACRYLVDNLWDKENITGLSVGGYFSNDLTAKTYYEQYDGEYIIRTAVGYGRFEKDEILDAYLDRNYRKLDALARLDVLDEAVGKVIAELVEKVDEALAMDN